MDIEPGLKIFHERVGVGRRERDEFFREGWEEVSMDNLSFKGAEGGRIVWKWQEGAPTSRLSGRRVLRDKVAGRRDRCTHSIQKPTKRDLCGL